MFKNNFGFAVLCGLISILSANMSFADSEVDELIALGEEKLQKAIEVREKSRKELGNETIDYETYEKRCNEAINRAMSVFDKAIAANPEDSNCYYRRGLAMMKWDKYDADAHKYADAHEYLDSMDSVRALLGISGALHNFDYYYFTDRRRMVSLPKYDDADVHEYFDKAIELNHVNAEAYYQKGLLFRMDFRDGEAIKQFDKAISYKPDFGDAYFYRGTLRGFSSDNLEIRRAIIDYKKAIEFSSNFTGSAYGLIGYLNWRLGYYDLSIESLTKAIEIEPDNSDHYYWCAYSKVRLGQVNSAVLDYDRAIQIQVKEDSMGYVGYIYYMLRKGYGMMEAERYKIVIDVCDKLIEHIEKIGDTFGKPWTLRCDAKIMLGDYKGALLDQENYLQIQMEEVQMEREDNRFIRISNALYKVGLLKSALGMYGVARQDLMEAYSGLDLDEYSSRLRDDEISDELKYLWSASGIDKYTNKYSIGLHIDLLLMHMRCIGKLKCKYQNDGRECEFDMLEKLREDIQNVDWSSYYARTE